MFTQQDRSTLDVTGPDLAYNGFSESDVYSKWMCAIWIVQEFL